MLLPPDGLVLPVRYVRCLSAERIIVALQPGGPEHVVELAGCRATGGAAARRTAEATLGDAERIHVFLPLVNADRLIAQFPRPLAGHLFVGSDETLSQRLVRYGLAEWRNAR